MINGTTQINVSDLNALPMIRKGQICDIGRMSDEIDNYNSQERDEIICSFLEG